MRRESTGASAVVAAILAVIVAVVAVGSISPGASAAPRQAFPGCDDYTPAGLVVSPTSAAPGTELTVNGTGVSGTGVQVSLRSPTGASAVSSDPVLVQPDGRWSTTIAVPADAVPGTWVVVATSLECETEATTEIEVPEVAGATTPPPGPSAPEVAGLAVDTPAGGTGAAAPASVAGLAFTGSSAHVLLALALAALGLGTIVLLSSRRRA